LRTCSWTSAGRFVGDGAWRSIPRRSTSPCSGGAPDRRRSPSRSARFSSPGSTGTPRRSRRTPGCCGGTARAGPGACLGDEQGWGVARLPAPGSRAACRGRPPRSAAERHRVLPLRPAFAC
jgi:hypothetical protein